MLKQAQSNLFIHVFQLLLMLALLFLAIFSNMKAFGEEKATEKKMQPIDVSSTAFSDGGMIPEKFTCDGENVNPPIEIKNVPKGTKSLALIVDDPDAPIGTWDHWLMWNLDPKTAKVQENATPPQAKVGKNDYKKMAYGGPCPPFGEHRYYFKVYALDKELDLPKGEKRKALERAFKDHIISEGKMMGRYKRAKR